MRHTAAALRWIAAVLLVVAVGGCSDSTEPTNGHATPDGLTISANAQTLVTVDGQAVTGQIDVAAAAETAHLTVTFVDQDGDPIQLSTDYYLEVESANETVAEFSQDTPGEFGGHVEGIAAGQTTMAFKLMHGQVGSGHPDYVSPAVPVQVN
ncbi:MAG: hypothetical protein PVH40_01105 [Gemmatimonadales bacterium]|jgi:hypothetical protein